MKPVQYLSPAKINLMLRVVGRRNDGYHLLQSCFQMLPWGDVMEFSWQHKAETELTISGFIDIPCQDNLIYQAAQKLKPYSQEIKPLAIKVDKKIPTGSGLGGGSSNAATTLKVLNEMWQCHLSVDKLQQIGLELGADVPFFISEKSALVTGVGEHITPMHFYQGYVLLIFPEVAISTAAVFNSPLLNRHQSKLPEKWLKSPGFWINDCLPVVLNDYPDVTALFKILSTELLLRLSGTGSTLFALFRHQEEAVSAQKIVDQHCRHALIKI